MFGPLLLILAIIIPLNIAIISSSGPSFWLLPMLMGILFLGIFGTTIGFSLYWRSKLTNLMASLAAHLEATNASNASRGMQWSIRSQRYYRSTAIWMQCDIPMSAVPMAAAPQASAHPVPGYPAGYPCPQFPTAAPAAAPPTSTPLPTYGGNLPTASRSPGQLPALANTPSPPPLQWPAGTAPPRQQQPAGSSAPPKEGTSGLDWPV